MHRWSHFLMEVWYFRVNAFHLFLSFQNLIPGRIQITLVLLRPLFVCLWMVNRCFWMDISLWLQGFLFNFMSFLMLLRNLWSCNWCFWDNDWFSRYLRYSSSNNWGWCRSWSRQYLSISFLNSSLLNSKWRLLNILLLHCKILLWRCWFYCNWFYCRLWYYDRSLWSNFNWNFWFLFSQGNFLW